MDLYNILVPVALLGAPTFRRFVYDDHNTVSRRSKRRILYAPNPEMKQLHHALNWWLRSRKLSLPSSTCGRKRQSPRSNVLRHRWQRYFYLLDIADAYKSVDGAKLATILCQLDSRLTGEESSTLDFLSNYCLEPGLGGLRTGAPASVDLFNVYGEFLIDRPLRELCKRYQLTYTRYLDDMTFSSTEPIGPRKRRAICACVRASGLPLNERKTGYYDIRARPVVITGIGLAWRGRLFLPRSFLNRIRGLLHKAIRDPSVPGAIVEGMMSVFWAAQEKGSLRNNTERKVIDLYKKWRLVESSC